MKTFSGIVWVTSDLGVAVLFTARNHRQAVREAIRRYAGKPVHAIEVSRYAR
jgi:hypothetical protein